MMMTLYCVAPEERRLKTNNKSGEGLWKTGGWRSVERSPYRAYLRFSVDWNLGGNSDINLQGDNLENVNCIRNLFSYQLCCWMSCGL